MTEIQWYFHYIEIMREKEKKEDKELETLKALLDTIKMAGVFSHPRINVEEILNNLKSDGKSQDEVIKDAVEYVENNKEQFPEVITVKLEKINKTNTPKGKINKKLGIIIPQ